MLQNQTTKKLHSYLTLAGSLVGITSQVQSQVVYTDIVPDVTINTNGGQYMLDLNNDGTVDFKLKLNIIASSSSVVRQVNATIMGANAAIGGSLYGGVYPLPYALAQNFNIGNTVTWNTQPNPADHYMAIVASSSGVGNWIGQTDKYLPLRIQIAGQNHYGWARLTVAANASSFTIKDYAYEASPNTPILAGANNGGNSSPVLSAMEVNPLVYITGDPFKIITSTVVLNDANDVDMDSASIKITTNFNANEDVLLFTTQNGITGNYTAATGVLKLSGTSTIANYQTALRSVKYQNTNAVAPNSSRNVTFTVNDGSVNSNVSTRAITILQANSIEKIEQNTISIYPNPATDVLNISGTEGELIVLIYDATGKEIYNHLQTEKSFSINVSEWNSGIYFIEIYNNNTVKKEKFIIR